MRFSSRMTDTVPAIAPTQPSQPTNCGSLLIVVAPSGAGKTSLVRHLLAEREGVRLSVSFTTRAPRPGEQSGIDYHFVSEPEFTARRDAGEFLEWALVHGNYYGTSKAWIAGQMAQGVDIVLEIDWQGAAQIRRLFPQAISIFIAPPSLETLRQRLTVRGQDSAEVIERRMTAAHSELKHAAECQYVIINQDFAEACRVLSGLLDAARTRFDQQYQRYPQLFDALGMSKHQPS
jgi:guanylate kinase